MTDRLIKCKICKRDFLAEKHEDTCPTCLSGQVHKDVKYDITYMKVAETFSDMSFAKRKKVGAVIVKDGNIISHGWNGTPTGFDNNCEIEVSCGCTFGLSDTMRKCPDCNGTEKKLITNPIVLHAELNALMKLSKSHESSNGSTLYVTLSPCIECSKLIIQSGIKEVVYKEEYRDISGIELLNKAKIKVRKLSFV